MKKFCAMLLAILMAGTPIIANAAVTVSNLKYESYGSTRAVSGTLTFDSSYLSGGETLNANQLGFAMIEEVLFQDSGGYTFDSVLAGDKLSTAIKVFRSGGQEYEVNDHVASRPSITLTHNANCSSNLGASALTVIEGYGSSANGIAILESNTGTGLNQDGRIGNATVNGAAVAPYFYVRERAVPLGVQLYIDDTGVGGQRLEFASASGQNTHIVMPFDDSASVSVGGFGVAITVYHDSTAATGGVPVYFDDNGAQNAQLCYTDADSASGSVAAGDIEIIHKTFADGNASATGPQLGSGVDLSSVSVEFVITGK